MYTEKKYFYVNENSAPSIWSVTYADESKDKIISQSNIPPEDAKYLTEDEYHQRMHEFNQMVIQEKEKGSQAMVDRKEKRAEIFQKLGLSEKEAKLIA